MKQFTYNGYLFLEVPEGSSKWMLCRDEPDEPTYISYLEKGNEVYRGGFDLPKLFQPECYTIIGLSKDLSERQMSEIFDTPANFIAVLRSQGLSETNTLVLKIK